MCFDSVFFVREKKKKPFREKNEVFAKRVPVNETSFPWKFSPNSSPGTEIGARNKILKVGQWNRQSSREKMVFWFKLLVIMNQKSNLCFWKFMKKNGLPVKFCSFKFVFYPWKNRKKNKKKCPWTKFPFVWK